MKTLLSALALGLVALVATDRARPPPERRSPACRWSTFPSPPPIIWRPVGTGDLSIIAAEGLATGTPQAGDLFVDIFVDFDPLDPAGTAGGAVLDRR